MTVVAFISITGPMVIVSIYNYLLPLPILYSLCLQQVLLVVLVLLLVQGPRLSFPKCMDHQQSCLDWLVVSIENGSPRAC